MPQEKKQKWRYYNEAPPEENMKSVPTHTNTHKGGMATEEEEVSNGAQL